jgi:tRNA dimethylallyltransferase
MTLSNRFRALCLAGPTAAGKTAAALALAQVLPLEIVSVDSALVYRGMDIGTAKPTAAERAAVPHHLIDILDPSESYSAARFAVDAGRAIAEIRARGKLPLLVGGTMLYFKALFEGLDTMPEASPALRAEIDAEAKARGWPALHAELARVDAEAAARLAPNDAQRIQRALEVWRVSGRPLSSFHRERQPADDNAAAWPLISLEPTDRAWLHARIEQRFDAMLAAGLEAEVAALRERRDLHQDLPSMRCVGYRQVWEALDDGEPLSVSDRIRERGIAASRQLAKRQLTWLRSMPQRTVVACDEAGAVDKAIAASLAAVARDGA